MKYLPKTFPYLNYALIKSMLFMALIGWCFTSSVILMRTKTEIVIVGIDENGARLIDTESDKLVKKEAFNFIKRFTFLFYSYDIESFDRNISEAGSLMSEALWKEKQEELRAMSEKLKGLSTPLAQVAKLKDVRIINEDTYEAMLDLRITSGIQVKTVTLKAIIRILKKVRSRDNPWQWEVSSYVEEEVRT